MSDYVIRYSGNISEELTKQQAQRLSKHELLKQVSWSLYQVVLIEFAELLGKGQFLFLVIPSQRAEIVGGVSSESYIVTYWRKPEEFRIYLCYNRKQSPKDNSH